MTTLTNTIRMTCTGLALAAGSFAMAAPTFEDKTLGNTYYCGDNDATNGVQFDFSDFEMTPGVFSNNGHAHVDNAGLACGTGQDLRLSNIYINFDLAGSVGAATDPVLNFGWYGGTMNLSINGDRHWAHNPGGFPATIGGCSVNITPLGSGCGQLEISGTVNSIGIGGQELWIDVLPDNDVPDGDCDWGYEDLAPTLAMNATTAFVTDGLPSKISPILRWDGSYAYGTVSVSHANQSCNTGQELQLDNAVLSHDLLGSGNAYENVAWAYGYYGGYITFEVNGDRRIETNIAALNGQNIGGCDVTIVATSADCGWIKVDGIVETIAIGGQELFMDCLKGDEVESDPVTPGDLDEDGDVDINDLMSLIAAFGSTCSSCPEDLDGDGDVDINDLMILLGNFGS